jgi:hypothetical protein
MEGNDMKTIVKDSIFAGVVLAITSAGGQSVVYTAKMIARACVSVY